MDGFNSRVEGGSMESTSRKLEESLRENLMNHYLDKLNRNEDLELTMMMLYLISLDMDLQGYFSKD